MKKDWMIKPPFSFDPYEINAITAILDKSCVVYGCAGSGKSLLALVKAARIQKEKNTSNYQVIVYTKALCEFLNDGKKQLGLKGKFTYYLDWKNRENSPSSDYIIVDEIQDFNQEEIQEFIQSAKKYFYFYGDTAQSIYDGMPQKGSTMPVEEIGYLFPSGQRPKYTPLCFNYRSPLPVAKMAWHIGVDLEPFDENTYKSAETAMPKFIQYNNIDEQIDAIIRIKRDHPELEDIGILAPTNEDVQVIHEKFRKKGFNHEVKCTITAPNGTKTWRDTLNFDTTNPKLMTYHSAKGLQFETVFLPAVMQPTSPVQQKALYVAMTRTYRDLYVMYSGNMPEILAQPALNGLYETQESEEVQNIKLENNSKWADPDDLPF